MSLSQSQSALYTLRSQIISGELQSGTKLRASHLAEQYDYSRTPISEALLKLESEGLLIRDKSGFTVRSFSVSDVYDAIDIRGLLEAKAAQRVAERKPSEEELRPLKALLGEMDAVIAQKIWSEYDALNEAFHEQLVELSESALLIEEVFRSYRLPFAGPSAFPSRKDDECRFGNSLSMGQTQHYQIIDAIENGETMRVFFLMREHARLANANVEAALSTKSRTPQLALVEKEI